MKNIILLYLFLLAFPQASHAASTNSKAPVLVTLPPLSGLVAWLEPNLTVQCLLPNNADPHHFQLTPRQVSALQQTSLLIRSPRDDKFWPGLNTSATTLQLWETSKHVHHEPNHTWLNPKEVAHVLPQLAQQLILISPEHKEMIEKQLQLALEQTDSIWQQWQKLVQTTHLKQRGIMMQHPSWQGMFEALGVPIREVLESAQHGQEYGPRKLEHALTTLKEYPNTVLIGDANHSNRALQWLQKRSGNTMVKLNALGQCNMPWLHLMQINIDTIKGTLQP